MRLALLSAAALCAATMGQAQGCPRFEMRAWTGEGAPEGALTLAQFDGGARVATEHNVISVKLGMDASGKPSLALKLDRAGAQALAEHTAAHLGQPLALILDGALVTAPRIQSEIRGGALMMPGLKDYNTAKAAMDALNSRDCPPPERG